MTENVNRSAMFLSTKHNIILNIAHLLCGKKPISSQYLRNGQDPTHGTATAYHMCNRALGL